MPTARPDFALPQSSLPHWPRAQPVPNTAPQRCPTLSFTRLCHSYFQIPHFSTSPLNCSTSLLGAQPQSLPFSQRYRPLELGSPTYQTFSPSAVSPLLCPPTSDLLTLLIDGQEFTLPTQEMWKSARVHERRQQQSGFHGSGGSFFAYGNWNYV